MELWDGRLKGQYCVAVQMERLGLVVGEGEGGGGGCDYCWGRVGCAVHPIHVADPLTGLM